MERVSSRTAIVRSVAAWTIVLLLLASTADASVIWVYNEIESVSASVSIAGFAGETFTDSHSVGGSLLRDPGLSGIGVNADARGFGPNYHDYIDSGLELGSGAAIRESGDGWIEFSAATGYGECGRSGCGTGSARSDIDLTFRAGGGAALDVRYYPLGGTVDAMLMDLTAGTIVYQVDNAPYMGRNTFEFGDNHLYRWVASGLSLSPPAGDPYGDFAMRFYDRVTNQGADFAPVPEPISIALLGSGVAGLMLRRRRASSARL